MIATDPDPALVIGEAWQESVNHGYRTTLYDADYQESMGYSQRMFQVS